MEIGFCAGHSALIMFLANPNIKLTVFDLMCHDYTRPCYEYIKRRFTTSQVYSGDSRLGVPAFIKGYPGHTFDLIHIDGSHEEKYFRADYLNSRIVSRPGTIIIFDDTSADRNAPINRLIREKIAAREIEIVNREALGLLETPRHEIVRVK
jgi:predicted O-methyltransferase YrrM